MEIRCVKGMYRLKLVSCDNNSGFKGLRSFSFLLNWDLAESLAIWLHS